MAQGAESAVQESPAVGQTTVEWIPAEYERLRVSRALGVAYDEVQQLLRVRPDEVLRFAYGADADGTGVSVMLSLHPSVRWPRVAVAVELFTPIGGLDQGAISIRWTPSRRGMRSASRPRRIAPRRRRVGWRPAPLPEKDWTTCAASLIRTAGVGR